MEEKQRLILRIIFMGILLLQGFSVLRPGSLYGFSVKCGRDTIPFFEDGA